jgi:hypothetical protein
MSGASASVAPPKADERRPAPSQRWRRLRFIPLIAGAGAFLLGVWVGLMRLGLALPGGGALVASHGALMISGFLGTVITLERAVAIGCWWAYAAPLLSAFAFVALVAGDATTAAVIFLLAGILLTFNSAFIVVRQPALFTVLLTVAAACWVAGTLIAMHGASPGVITGWWLSFLVLTIVAERLELSRLLSPPRSSQWAFVFAVALILAGAARGEYGGASAPVSGLGLLAVTAWLVRHDIARRTIRFAGLARFSAACILAGYVWLVVAGLLLLIVPPGAAVFSYDAIVHTIAIGFVLSMIFGHAPIILPAVTGLKVRYHAAAYLPLALLHVSVLLRTIADLLGYIDLRMVSGPITLLAFVVYAATLIIASRR